MWLGLAAGVARGRMRAFTQAHKVTHECGAAGRWRCDDDDDMDTPCLRRLDECHAVSTQSRGALGIKQFGWFKGRKEERKKQIDGTT